MNEYTKQYVVPAIVVEQYHPELKQYLPEGILRMHIIDTPNYANVSTHELAKEMKLESFDTALPQPWVDEFRDKTGFNPVGQMVWAYDNMPIWGEPIAVTRQAQVALDIFNHITREEN